MPNQIYEVVSQGARYWFLFLMVLIAWRSYRWLARDRKQRKKRLKLLPDAGYVGELVVVQGNAELPEGLALPVSGEGTLGCLRGNDVYVPVKGVSKKHLWYEFDDEQGLRVEAYGRRRIEVDGKSFTGRHAHTYLTHGARLVLGDAVLRLRMFAGFEYAGIKHAIALDEEHEPDIVETSAVQPMTVQMPTGNVTFTQEQLAAFQQMQWMAAWQTMQAAQGMPQTGVPVGQNMEGNTIPGALGNQPTQVGMPAGTQTSVVPAVLATEKGQFLAPPKTAVGGAILPNVDVALPEDVPENTGSTIRAANAAPVAFHAQRHPRHNPLPSIAETASDGSEWMDMPDYPPETSAEDGPTADELWASTRAGDRDASLRRLPDDGMDFTYDSDDVADHTTFAPRVTFYPPVLEEETFPVDSPETHDVSETGMTEETWPYAAYPQRDVRFAESGYTYPEYVEPVAADEPYEYADEDEAPRSLYVEPDEAAQAKRVLWDKYLKGGRRP